MRSNARCGISLGTVASLLLLAVAAMYLLIGGLMAGRRVGQQWVVPQRRFWREVGGLVKDGLAAAAAAIGGGDGIGGTQSYSDAGSREVRSRRRQDDLIDGGERPRVSETTGGSGEPSKKKEKRDKHKRETREKEKSDKGKRGAPGKAIGGSTIGAGGAAAAVIPTDGPTTRLLGAAGGASAPAAGGGYWRKLTA